MRPIYRAVEGPDKQHRERGLTGFSSVNIAFAKRMSMFHVRVDESTLSMLAFGPRTRHVQAESIIKTGH